MFVFEFEYAAREASKPKGDAPAPRPGSPKRRVIPGSRPARANWRVRHATERWAGWDHGASLSEHLSDPERDAPGALISAVSFVGYIASRTVGLPGAPGILREGFFDPPGLVSLVLEALFLALYLRVLAYRGGAGRNTGFPK